MPAISENIGISIAAFAVPEVMIAFNTDWKPYIMLNAPTFPLPDMLAASELRKVSIILPSSKITIMPEAKPTTKAAESISFAPAMNNFAISLAFFPKTIPLTIAMVKNKAAICSNPQSNAITPMTR